MGLCHLHSQCSVNHLRTTTGLVLIERSSSSSWFSFMYVAVKQKIAKPRQSARRYTRPITHIQPCLRNKTNNEAHNNKTHQHKHISESSTVTLAFYFFFCTFFHFHFSYHGRRQLRDLSRILNPLSQR